MILVFDGNPFIYRGQNRNPSQAFAGAEHLLSSLIDAVRASRPDRVIVLFDPKGGYWRHALYPAYKEHRKKPELSKVRVSVRKQIDHMKILLKHLPVSVLCCEGYEADDAAYWLKDYLFGEVTFVTIDRDWLQLVDDGSHVFLFDISEKITIDTFHSFECTSKPSGLDQDEFLMFKMIVGDVSDNIKGINGLGPVKTMDLIKGRSGQDLEQVIKQNSRTMAMNLLLMDLKMVPFLPFSEKVYRAQLRTIGKLNIQKLKPLMVHELWSLSGELDLFKYLEHIPNPQ